MLNAIQHRMVEEALVEKETYEAMETMRARIDALGGHGKEPQDIESAPPGQHVYPDLPDLPTGKDPRQQERYPVPQEAGDGALPEVKAAGPIPTEVMALGDPTREKDRPVAPYVPPTTPISDGDPFPQLGPKGQPLG